MTIAREIMQNLDSTLISYITNICDIIFKYSNSFPSKISLPSYAVSTQNTIKCQCFTEYQLCKKLKNRDQEELLIYEISM